MSAELHRWITGMAWATALATVVTFALALTAVPSTGAFCPADCMSYPYADAVDRFPRDYLWMFPATLQLILYGGLFSLLAEAAQGPGRSWAVLARSAALLATGVLLANYYLQISVAPISLLSGETDGLALLTQYNARGIFIALEELGYLLMALSFACLAPAVARSARGLRATLLAGPALVVVALAGISVVYGIDRQDRFEVVVITVDWIVLLTLSIVLGRRGLPSDG